MKPAMKEAVIMRPRDVWQERRSHEERCTSPAGTRALVQWQPPGLPADGNVWDRRHNTHHSLLGAQRSNSLQQAMLISWRHAAQRQRKAAAASATAAACSCCSPAGQPSPCMAEIIARVQGST